MIYIKMFLAVTLFVAAHNTSSSAQSPVSPSGVQKTDNYPKLANGIADKCVSGNCVNGKGKMVYANGDIYEGDFVNGKKEGQGTFTFKHGTVYVGRFANDKFSGKGKLIYNGGEIYDGNFVNGEKEGQGTHTYPTGSYYTGEFKDGKQHGYGKEYNKATNTTRVGTWKDDDFVDATTAVASPPTTSNGCVSGNCVNGKGKKVYDNGNTYEGDFVVSKLEGQGTFTTTNGQIYIGQFANDKYNGKGKYTFPSGEIYDGNWVNDKKEGQGTLTLANGQVYVGQFANNVYNGKGKIKFANGNIYEGDFGNDKREGQGTLTFPSGEIYIGQFSNDVRNGKGKNTFSNGNIYDGNWVNDKREGQGTLTFPNGSYYIGEWKNDNYNGYAKYYDKAANTVQEGTWKDGVLVNANAANAGQRTFTGGEIYDKAPTSNSATTNNANSQGVTAQGRPPQSSSVLANILQKRRSAAVAAGHTILGSGVYDGYTVQSFEVKYDQTYVLEAVSSSSFSIDLWAFGYLVGGGEDDDGEYTDNILLTPTHSWEDSAYIVGPKMDHVMKSKVLTQFDHSMLLVNLGITRYSRIKKIFLSPNKDKGQTIHWIFYKLK